MILSPKGPSSFDGACASKNRRGASRTGLRREFVPTMESPRNIERKVRFHSELFRLASPPVPAPAPPAKAKAGRRKMAAAPSHFAFMRILLGLRLSACKTPAQERTSHTPGRLDLIVPGRRPHDPAINRVFTFAPRRQIDEKPIRGLLMMSHGRPCGLVANNLCRQQSLGEIRKSMLASSTQRDRGR
jgi:hypothetical protein